MSSSGATITIPMNFTYMNFFYNQNQV